MQRVRYSEDCGDSAGPYLSAVTSSDDRKPSLKSEPQNSEVEPTEANEHAAQMSRYSRSSSRSPFSFRHFNRNCSYLSRRESAFLQELAATSPQQRNWRGILTALLVIVIMCSIIAIAVLILTPCKFLDPYDVGIR